MVSSPSSRRVAEAAERLGLEVQIREFPYGTRTAEDAARAIGVHVGQIVKSLIFLADDRPILCLGSGANRLDTLRLARASSASTIRRATPDEVQRSSGFAIGGVPPFGHRSPLPVYCDHDLLAYDTVWAAAGTPSTVFATDPQHLAQACYATIADLKEEA
jgi:prolyl-tRNA editing enzyme YbaK/EbsC (Cys-tRNA(Pro) deacylase)